MELNLGGGGMVLVHINKPNQLHFESNLHVGIGMGSELRL